jgi:hypothetical protein
MMNLFKPPVWRRLPALAGRDGIELYRLVVVGDGATGVALV